VDQAPTQLFNLLKKLPNARVACLIPSDLVNLVRSAGKNQPNDQEIEDIISNKSTAITFLDLEQTWLIFNLPRKINDIIIRSHNVTRKAEIFTGEISQEENENDSSDNIKVLGRNLLRWIEAQSLEREQIVNSYGEEDMLVDGNGLVYIKVKGTTPKIYVPKPERKDLVMKTHRMLAHGMIKRVRKVIEDTHIWPGMYKDMKRWLEECDECPLAKAKKNIAHNQYSPLEFKKPRNAYGIDFYEIDGSENGYVGVLTIVDLFTRFVLYIPIKDQMATTASTLLLHNIIYGRGPFKYLVSDGARSFTGSVIQHLTRSWGIDHIKTFYWPQGNAIAERNHVVLGEFLRLLPESRRNCWEQDIPALAYAVNMSVNTATGFSPFELDCGYQPPSLHDVEFQELPVEVQDLLPQNYKYSDEQFAAYQARTQALLDIAAKHAEAARMVEMEYLNNDQGPKVTFEVGERVIVYAPSSASSEGSQKWKPKHRLQWRRATVLKKLSNTTYVLKDEEGKSIQRSVALIVRDKSAKSKPEANDPETVGSKAPSAMQSSKFCIGGLVAALQEEGGDTYEIAKIVNLTNTHANIRYYGTTNGNVENAVFKLAWTIKGGRMMLKNSKPRQNEQPEEYVGRVHRDLLVAKVNFNNQGRLDSESKRKLNDKGLKHHFLSRIVKEVTKPAVESKANSNSKKRKKSQSTPFEAKRHKAEHNDRNNASRNTSKGSSKMLRNQKNMRRSLRNK
jgi:hypothetical protein